MTLNDLHSEAVLAAEVLLADHSFEYGQPVPIFDLIESRGVWLSFEPLKVPLGAYLRKGDAAGIAINNDRPPALQRFTAAHELGHHELGHQTHVDDDATIGNRSRDPKEIQAQTFAASLLMSELSIEVALEDRHLDPISPSVTAQDCYQLSVALGVSYLAFVTQLRSLGKISRDRMSQLSSESPLSLKTAVRGGAPPVNNWASVFHLTFGDNGRTVWGAVGDEVVVDLPLAPLSDCSWSPPANKDRPFTLTSQDVRESNDGSLFGGASVQRFVYRLDRVGESNLDFRLADPEEREGSASVYRVRVGCTRLPVSEENRGLSVNQQAQLLMA